MKIHNRVRTVLVASVLVASAATPLVAVQSASARPANMVCAKGKSSNYIDNVGEIDPIGQLVQCKWWLPEKP